MKTVVIFGGSGYVGQHVIRRIAKNGYKIIIPHQAQANEAKLRLLGSTSQVLPVYFKSLDQDRIIKLILSADIVINLKTQWDEKVKTYKQGILDFNINLIKIIKNSHKNIQFIYFSGIGVDDKSISLRSDAIFQTEKYIQKNLKDASVIRPGIILGGNDKFLKGLLPLFKISFFIPLFGSGTSKLQPIFIDDVSMGVKKIIELNKPGFNIFEFVGPNIFTYKELYEYLATCLNRTRVLTPIPMVIAKFLVSIMEKTPFSPLNTEQLKLFETNNIATNKFKKLNDLKVSPQDLKEIIKKIIKKNY